MAEQFLTKPLDSYPSAHTPACSDRLPKLFEEARSTAKNRTIDAKLQKEYRSLVGSLQYAASTVRSDVLYTVGLLGRALTFPTPELYDAAMRVLVYLARHENYALRYSSSAPNASTLWAWTDSDWSVMWSTTGVVLMLAGAAILCVSRRQHCITLSSTEAELMAMSAGAVDVIYMRGLLDDLGLPQQNVAVKVVPTPLRCDNKGAKDLSHDRSTSARSRHIDRRWFFVRELQHQGVVSVIAVPTADNISDLMTKVLNLRDFEKFVKLVMNLPAPSISQLVLSFIT